MPRTAGGALSYRIMRDRNIGEGFRGYMKSNQSLVPDICTIDQDKAYDYKKNSLRKSVAPAIDKQKARDLLLYKQTEQMNNILLENTREQRMKEQKRMKALRAMGTNKHSLFSPLSQHFLGLTSTEPSKEVHFENQGPHTYRY